ncbi:ABC transporter permease [Metabacillus halosaccharovorans]|uniref:ABC transporter permease n=1 Tax=Metabacillus halosaccharovorans TaxID=930124 RepID=UPI00203CC7FD|nr:ABC transporter permease [Metabacillus halosaccharovorans]MCM3442745.1 ABC transporter permease [Metabacillus halosaccharovorans]
MNILYQLIRNENQKLYKRMRMWIFLGFIVVANILIGLFFHFLFKDTEFSFWDYVQVSSYVLLVIQLISIIIAGDIVSSEFERGTIKFLLIRPVKRVNILVSKYITVQANVFLLGMFQLFLSIIIGLIFYADSLFLLDQRVLVGLGSYLFQLIEIGIITSIAFGLSAITRSSVISIALPIFLVFTSSALMTLFQHYHVDAAKYLLFANTNLMPYFFGEPMFEGMTLLYSIVIIMIHMMSFFLLAGYLFTKKDVHV